MSSTSITIDPSELTVMNCLPSFNSFFRYMQFYFGWFGSPILLTGDYPRVMRSLVDSKALRFYQSHFFFS